MARTTGINLDANPQADGFKLGGGTTKRTVTFTGADMTLTGSGTFVQTMPGASSTLLGIAATATAGSIIFAGSTLMAEDNANFFWDGTNHTLGVGTTRTGAISGTNPGLRIKGTGTTSSTSSFEVQDSGATTILFARNDGLIGIGTNAPGSKLHIAGSLSIASWTTNGVGIQVAAATYTDSSTANSGTVASSGIHAFAQPTIASTGTTVTYTSAATIYIANAPANGTNVTITNAYALWSAAGKVRIDGTLLLNAITSGSIIFAGTAGLLSQDNANFFFDGTNHTLGVGNTRAGAISGTNPGTRLKGSGATSSTSSFEVQDSAAATILFVRDDGRVSIGTNTATSKFHIAGNISLASWTTAGAGIQVAAITFTDNSTANSGTVTNSGIHALAQPTIASTGTTVTYTNAANLYIANAPVAGTNVTITNAYSMWVAAGASRFDGNVNFNAMTSGSALFAGTSGLLSQDNANFFWDGTNHTLGVGTTRTGAISGTNPGLRVKGTGTTSSTSSFEVQDSGATTILFVRNDGLVGIGTNAPGSKLHITGNLSIASWTTNGAGIQAAAATYTDTSTANSGTVASSGIHAFAQPTIASTGTTVTYTSAANIYIANAPANGTNVTITNKYALWVAAGISKFDGAINATKAVSTGVASLTDAATIATDASLGNHFRVTLGGNRTLGNPTNPTDGQKCTWEIIQDGTGSRTLAYDTQFAFGTDIASITLTTGINKRDFIGAIYNSTATKWYIVSVVKGY